MMAAVEVGSWWIMALCIGIVTGETLKNCHYSRCAYRIYIYEFDCHGHGPSSVRASVHVFVCVCVCGALIVYAAVWMMAKRAQLDQYYLILWRGTYARCKHTFV